MKKNQSKIQTSNTPQAGATGKKPARKQLPFFFPEERTAPYLARRGRPNPKKKKDGTPGDLIPVGNWYIYQTIGKTHHRHSLKTANFEEAKKLYANWLVKRENLVPSKGSLSSLLRELGIRQKKSLKKGSKRTAAGTIKLVMTWLSFMKLPYSKLKNLPMLEEWNTLSEPATKTLPDGTEISHPAYSPNTLDKARRLLRRLVKLAVKNHFISQDNDLLEDFGLDDWDHSCPDRVKKLTSEMFDKIRDCVYNGSANRHPHVPAIFDCYWMSGGRRGSVANIHTEDVIFEKNMLFFRTAKNHPEGYYVPLSPDLAVILRAHIEKYGRKIGQKIFEVANINCSLATACLKAGWTVMSAHDFRHLFACFALQKGMSFAQIALWLGHTDGGVLAAQVYAAPFEVDSLRNMQKMNFLSRTWSAEGAGLMRTAISGRLSDLSKQVAEARSQADIERLLGAVKELVDNPIAATEIEPVRVIKASSVMPW